MYELIFSFLVSRDIFPAFIFVSSLFICNKTLYKGEIKCDNANSMVVIRYL